MKTLGFLFLLLAPAVLAADAPAMAEGPRATQSVRSQFPDDYVRQACAPKGICTTYGTNEIPSMAAVGGATVRGEWIRTHWDELMVSIEPWCEKIANCESVPGNEWVWCKDLTDKLLADACEPYKADDPTYQTCWAFMGIFSLGQDGPTSDTHQEAQRCALEAIAGKPKGKLDVWMVPARLSPSFEGTIKFYALDQQTRLPVMADIRLDAGKFHVVQSLNGFPTTGYPLRYKPELKAVTRADGHRDLVLPAVTITSPYYEPVEFRMPIETSEMILETTTRSLKRGMNTITIKAKDSVTGEPVEARVMGDDRVLGKTNVPFQVEWKKGKTSPEIWVTSLYDRYSDQVVFPKKK
jgi:hypothetical protein